MNVNEIVNIIKDIAKVQKGVHSVFDGDVYENWNSAEAKYGSVNIGLQNMTYNANFITYTFVLYYGDRLLQDKKNVNSVYSDGLRVLQSIINKLNTEDGVDIPEEIVYTPFEQKFMDYLAGVYASVDITCESELGMCDIEEFDEPENYLWCIYKYQNSTDIQEIPQNMIDEDGNLKILDSTYGGYALIADDIRNLKNTIYDGSRWYYNGIDVNNLQGYSLILVRVTDTSYKDIVKQCRGLADEITTNPDVLINAPYYSNETNRNTFIAKLQEMDGKVIRWKGRTQYIVGINDISTEPTVYHYTQEDDKYATTGNAIFRGHTLLKEGHDYKLTLKRFNHFFKSYTSDMGQYISGWVICFDEV